MRALLSLLLIATLVLGTWSFFDAETFLMAPTPAGYDWWWPSEVSTYGQDIDWIFKLVSAMILPFFILTFVIMIVGVWRYSAPLEGHGSGSHGNHKLEMLWTAIPAVLLVVIAFSQMGTWYKIKYRSAIAGETIGYEVWAEQFAWRFRYPGVDGVFGTYDDVETATEWVLPVDEKILFNLRSRDVLHSIFIPKLRVKQDAVPGMTIPNWFQIDPKQFRAESRDILLADGSSGKELSFDLICTELCGWGHYKMAGRVRILSRNAYDEWMQAQLDEKYSNGQEAGQ